MDLRDTVVILTGSAGAIGRATERELLRQGARVVAVDIEAPAASGERVLACRADVTDRAAVKAVVEEACQRFGTVDVLINNAALLSGIGALWEVDPERWWADMTVNLYGTLVCTQAVLPLMQARGTGVLLNMVGGGLGGPNAGASGYGCSKVAIARFTDTLAAELTSSPGIRVFALAPGFVRSTITEDLTAAPDEHAYFGYVRDWLAEGKDNPAEGVAQALCAMIARAEKLPNGRIFRYHDDFDELTAQKDLIEDQDLRQVRFIEEPKSFRNP